MWLTVCSACLWLSTRPWHSAPLDLLLLAVDTSNESFPCLTRFHASLQDSDDIDGMEMKKAPPPSNGHHHDHGHENYAGPQLRSYSELDSER